MSLLVGLQESGRSPRENSSVAGVARSVAVGRPGFQDLNDCVGSSASRRSHTGQPKSPDDNDETNGSIISNGDWIGDWLIATISIRVVPVVFLGALRSKMPFDMVSVFAVAVVFVWVKVGVWPFDPSDV
jgi:hypothetical protein